MEEFKMKLDRQYIIEQRVKSLIAMEDVLFTLYAGAYSDWSSNILAKYKDSECHSVYDAYWLIARNKNVYKKYIKLFFKLQETNDLHPKY